MVHKYVYNFKLGTYALSMYLCVVVYCCKITYKLAW